MFCSGLAYDQMETYLLWIPSENGQISTNLDHWANIRTNKLIVITRSHEN